MLTKRIGVIKIKPEKITTLKRRIILENFFYLDNGTIKVRILYPDGVKYDRSRWCHTGFIQDVWCNGARFSEYERNRHGEQLTSEGCGLCCGFFPIAPGEDEPGKLTILPGVGVGTVKAPNAEKDRLNITEHFDIKVSFDETSAVFETKTPCVNGYAYLETRKIELCGSEIKENVTFKNIGEKEIHTREFCHNFLSLPGMEISPDYVLEVFAADVPEGFENHAMYFENGHFTFSRYPEKPFFFDTVTNIKPCNDYAWIMRTKTGKAFCYGKIDFTPVRVSVWGDYYTLCPEIFVGIDLAPGEEKSWQRTWGFSLGE